MNDSTRKSHPRTPRIGSKALKPGRYRAVLVARNDGGKSKPVRLTFRVVRR